MNESEVIRSFTAFIDILGFSEKISRASSIEDIKKIEKVIGFVQRQFEHSPMDSLTIEDHKLYSKQVLAFSDCIVVNLPYVSEITKLDGTYDPILSELCRLAYAQGACVLSGVFLRGGVDIGWWYQQGSTLISSGLNKAYKLERKVRYPVLALTDDLYNFFCKHPHNKFYSKGSNPLKSELRRYKRGKVEFVHIDYIRICLSGIGWQRSRAQLAKYKRANPEERDKIVEKGYRDNTDAWLKKHSSQIRKAFNACRTEKVRGKYRWLARYHNSVAKNISNNKNVLCIL